MLVYYIVFQNEGRTIDIEKIYKVCFGDFFIFALVELNILRNPSANTFINEAFRSTDFVLKGFFFWYYQMNFVLGLFIIGMSFYFIGKAILDCLNNKKIYNIN